MFIERILAGEIQQYLESPEIIAVVGPRQAGKTTLIKNILRQLDDVTIVTFDNLRALQLFKNDINSFIEIYAKTKYLFIDEIQYAPESGKHLKYIFDTQPVKIIVSGSSSAEISIQSLKYLVGRIFVFMLYPLSFNEFLRFRSPELYNIYSSGKFGEEIHSQLNTLIQEFILFGAYPRVAVSNSMEEKLTVLQNILNTLLLRDVQDIFQISDVDKMSALLKSFALLIGDLINYAELSDLTGLRHSNLKKFIRIFEEMYVIRRCLPYSKNRRTEIVKNPKVYFLDSGLRNAIINNFEGERSDFGKLYENLVYSEFVKKGKAPNFWRTKSGAEVDFVSEGIPYEIKSTPRFSKSLRSFVNKYSPECAYIVSKSEKETEKLNGTELRFLPFGKII